MKFELGATVRDRSGKGVARKLRNKGLIPGVLYGQGECVLLSLDPEAVLEVIQSHVSSTALITLNVDGAKTKKRTAMLRDYQADPVTGQLLHADLFEVSMDKPIRLKVPTVVIGGMPAGVKEGGVLHHVLREVYVECLPGVIPDKFEVDASALTIGQGLHVRDLTAPAGVRILDGPEQTVLSVAAPMSDAKLEALLTSKAVVEEGKEPEVIAKGKIAEGEEGAVAPAAGEKAAPAAEAKAGAKPEAAAAAKGEKKEAKEEKKK
jgi:large subunit ribosomal protein L25